MTCYATAELDRWERQMSAEWADEVSEEIAREENIRDYCEVAADHLRAAGFFRLADEIEAGLDPIAADEAVEFISGHFA